MPRLLFGFVQRRGRVLPQPAELAVVRAVLTHPRCPAQLARLTPSDSPHTIRSRIRRIRSHADDYRQGRPCLGWPPDPTLAALVTAP